MTIRLAVPDITPADLKAVTDVLETGFLVQGAKVAAFEQAFARYVGVPHAVAVSNCTAALHMSLAALDIGPGDIVIVPCYSWPATANAVELVGATPHFVDIEPATFGMDPVALERAIGGLTKSGKLGRVKAILLVHAFGRLADTAAIKRIADQHKLLLLEDAACALGARSTSGAMAGAIGTLGCFSFHPRKALTTGEGGMITTFSKDLADRLRALRNHGLDSTSATPDFILPGFNYRMTEFQAALGISQLSRFDQMLKTRREKAATYLELLAGSRLTVPVQIAEDHSFQSFVVLLPPGFADRRGAIIAELKTRGIETTIGTYHMPMIRFFREKYGFASGMFAVTDDLAERSLSLPLSHLLTLEAQRLVVETLLQIVNR